MFFELPDIPAKVYWAQCPVVKFLSSSRWASINSFPTLRRYRGGCWPPVTLFDEHPEGEIRITVPWPILCLRLNLTQLLRFGCRRYYGAWTLQEVKWGRMRCPLYTQGFARYPDSTSTLRSCYTDEARRLKLRGNLGRIYPTLENVLHLTSFVV